MPKNYILSFQLNLNILDNTGRWIGLGLLCMGLGSLVWTLPHFTSPAYVTSDQETEESSSDLGLCGGGGREEDYEPEEEVLANESQKSSSLQNYR